MKVQQQTNSPNFGMNFAFAKEFSKKASTLLPENQQEVVDTFQAMAKDKNLLKDTRTVMVGPKGIQVLDKHLGSITYGFRLTKESIEQAVKNAFEDKINVEALPRYAKSLSKKMGINLTFNPKDAFYVAGSEPASRFKDTLDFIAQKASQFPDKKDIKIDVFHGRACNTFEMQVTRGDKRSIDSALFSGSDIDPADIQKRLEWLNDNLDRALGDKVPGVAERGRDARYAIDAMNAKNAVSSFNSRMETAGLIKNEGGAVKAFNDRKAKTAQLRK